MRRPNRPKASHKLPHEMWNHVWQLFCPWVTGGEVAPIRIPAATRRRRSSLRSLVAATVLAGAIALISPAHAEEFNQDGQIILASLNTTVPGDNNTAYPELFGSTEQRHTDIRPFTKWTGVLKRFKETFTASLNQPEVQDWMKMLASVKNSSDEDKIEAVNEYMNNKKFISDANNYGERDHWATPMEFLARGGDCEDYAIAKYISLRALGFTQDKMRLAIVYDRVMRMPHALLIVYHNAEAEVLDNQNPAVMDSAEITRYKPIYSISQVAWWRH